MLNPLKHHWGGSARADLPQVELVEPDNGKRESLWVAIFVLLVLVSGVFGISLRKEPPLSNASLVDLSPVQSQLLVELSIALEEIGFVSQAPWPSPDELADMGVSIFLPNQSGRWHQPQSDCYQWISHNHQGDFVLRLSDKRIYWHPGAVVALSDCQLDSHWILLEN